MSTYSLDHVWSLRGDVLAWFDNGALSDAKSVSLVDQTVALRRCALYRNAFKGTAVSYPAALLGFDAPSAWMRRQRVTVDVMTVGGLDRAMAAGVDPARIVVLPGDGDAALIRRAVSAGAARFVVGSSEEIAILAGSAGRTQRVVLDATDDAAGTLASEVLAHPRLELIGLHCSLGDTDDAIGAAKLRRLIAEMSWIRREHGVLLTRVSLAGLDVGERALEPWILRRVAEAIGEVIGDECARHRHPRPALTVSLGQAALMRAW